MPFLLKDIQHINGCKICQNMMLHWVEQGKQPLSPAMLAWMTNTKFKDQVIQAVCLRVAHLSTEHEDA